ncbi:MAG: DUF1273 family protein [Clostridia bacterium]|nr:DUF1273 family protein [Clostridia bacterium]
MEDYKTCCCFGHRDVFVDITNELDNAVLMAIQNGCRVFMTGGNGGFDSRFAASVRKAKKQFPYISLELIKPYYSSGWNAQKEYYTELYDAIVVPDELSLVHYKSAITVCNRWMVDRSDMVIAYVHRDFGGAFTAVRYAQKKQKRIIHIANSSL